ncbi:MULTISPECIES: SCO family protein [Chitinophagaceae]
MKKKKLVWFYVIFFAAVLVIYLTFVLVGGGGWTAKPVVLNNVKPFTFKTQDGQPFTRQELIGKVTVVEYFFTNCQGICPHLNANMEGIYNDFKDEPDFQIVSHTCDPDRDTVARMKVYADSMQVDEHKWFFLTGRKDSLYNAARESYLLDDPKNGLKDINDQFMHTQFFAVVDKNAMVRGQIFDGLKKNEIVELEDLVRTLLKEKVGPPNTNFLLNK